MRKKDRLTNPLLFYQRFLVVYEHFLSMNLFSLDFLSNIQSNHLHLNKKSPFTCIIGWIDLNQIIKNPTEKQFFPSIRSNRRLLWMNN